MLINLMTDLPHNAIAFLIMADSNLADKMNEGYI